MIDLASQLKKGKGLCVVAMIVEGKLLDQAENAELLSEDLEKVMENAGLKGFAHTLVSPTFREGKTSALQLAGLGPMTPNTVLLSWPHHWNHERHRQDAEVFVETIVECTRLHKAMVVAFNIRNFPKLSKLHGFVDVWWIMHDGGLLILMAHLMTRHRIWQGCTLRVFVVAGPCDNSLAMQAELETLLGNARIKGKVEVVELVDAEDLVAYTHNWTLRVNEAKRFTESIKEQQSGQSPVREGIARNQSWHALTKDIFKPPEPKEDKEEEALEPCIAESSRSAKRVFISDEVKVKSIPQELDFLPGMRHDKERPRNTKWTTTSSSNLNQLIKGKSKDSQLVVLNLPDPLRNIPPEAYMEYCEGIVKGIRRVLFVHGTGNEVWNH